jgi:hypothetical protein
LKKTIGATRFYFLTNPTNKPTSTTVDFVERAAPELWDPWTGSVQKAAFTRKSGHASVQVSLPPFGSQLLAFNDANRNGSTIAPVTWTETKRQNVGEAGWSVDAVGNSEKGIGVQVHVDMAKLADWVEEPILRTFSGRAAYVTHISVTADDFKTAERILLDLGEVKDAAEVKINGVTAGQLLVHPFLLDVHPLLHRGENEIEVTVVNSLTNYVSTIQWPKNPTSQIRHYPPTSAGLLGPVALKYETSSSSQ